MSNTLSSYRADIRLDIDDTDYSAAVIDRAINDYINEIAMRSKYRRLETSDDLFIAQGDFEVEFPDDKMVLLNMSVTSPSPARRIMDNYMSYNDFVINHPGYATVGQQAVAGLEWTDFGDGMRLSAPASADTTVSCEYIRVPSKLESDSDENELDPNDVYHEMFVIGGKVRAMERNEDYEEAAEERKKLSGRVINGIYRPGLEEVFIRNEGRGGIKSGPNIMGAGRHRRGNYRVDRDF